MEVGKAGCRVLKQPWSWPGMVLALDLEDDVWI